MILGLLSELDTQRAALPATLVRALDALKDVQLLETEAGRYEIEGDKLYYMVQDVEFRTMEESRAEAHAQYADIQIPLTAHERYGFSLPQPGLLPSEDLLEEKDLAFYPTPAAESFFDLAPGSYVVFLPGELHRPCLAIDDQGSMRKVVVKIHVSLLVL
jgi:biofilm protein TabA